jgi:hypothetical protein
VNPSLSGPRDAAAIHSLDKVQGQRIGVSYHHLIGMCSLSFLDLLKDKKQCVKLFYSKFRLDKVEDQ